MSDDEILELDESAQDRSGAPAGQRLPPSKGQPKAAPQRKPAVRSAPQPRPAKPRPTKPRPAEEGEDEFWQIAE
jgi:hypothetical protein